MNDPSVVFGIGFLSALLGVYLLAEDKIELSWMLFFLAPVIGLLALSPQRNGGSEERTIEYLVALASSPNAVAAFAGLILGGLSGLGVASYVSSRRDE